MSDCRFIHLKVSHFGSEGSKATCTPLVLSPSCGAEIQILPKKSHFSDKESILDSKIKPFSKNKHIYCVNNRCWRSDYINNCTAAIKPRVLLFTTHPSLSVFTERGSQTIHVVVNHASRAAGRTSPLSCEATFWVSASQKHVKVM